MEPDSASGKIPATVQREIRSKLASLGIKLTIVAEELKQETDPERARDLRDQVVALKAEAKAVMDKYKWAKNLYNQDLVAEAEASSSAAALDDVLVFGDLDAAPHPDAVAPVERAAPHAHTAPLPELDDVALVLDLGDSSSAVRAIEAEARVQKEAAEPMGVLDEVAFSLTLAEEASALPTQQEARGGRLGLALGILAETAARRETEWGEPLLGRALATVAFAIERGTDEDETIAAALAPVVDESNEDLLLQEIRSRFGERAVELVAWSAWMLRIDPWEQRDRAYLKRMESAPAPAILISVCGRLLAARSMLARRATSGTGSLDRPGRDRTRLVWSQRALVKAYRTVADPMLVGQVLDEWERAVATLEGAVGTQDDGA